MKHAFPVFRADRPASNILGRCKSPRVGSPKRAAILAATRGIIDELGCDQVKMRVVAERSLVTPPTVYAIVGNRHDLMDSALQEGLRVKFALASRRAREEDVNPCLAFVATKLDAIARNPSYYRHIDRASRLAQFDASTARSIYDAIERQFLCWIKEMSEQHQLCLPRNMPLTTIAKALAHQLNIPVARWAAGEYGLVTLRSDLIAAMILPLFAITTEGEQARMNRWLDQHA